MLSHVPLTLDSSCGLSARYSFDGDALHVNRAGAKILAIAIKQTVEKYKFVRGTSYSHAVSGQGNRKLRGHVT